MVKVEASPASDFTLASIIEMTAIAATAKSSAFVVDMSIVRQPEISVNDNG